MGEQPEGCTKDTKNTAKDNIEQPTPVDKQDPTEPVGVESGQGSLARGGKAACGTVGL
jgi:hypothetical protein